MFFIRRILPCLLLLDLLVLVGCGAGNFAMTSQGSPNLTIVPVVGKSFGVSPFIIEAHSDSSGPIAYSVVSGPASIKGNLVTLMGAGTVSISASQIASSDYLAGQAVTTFTAAPAASSLLLAPVAQQVFGSKPIALFATSQSPSPIFFTVVSGPANITGNLLSLSGAGSVTVSASQSPNPNYTTETATDSFAVSPGVPGLSFSSINPQVFGSAPFSVGTVSASPAPISLSVASGPGVIVGNTVKITGAGTICLRASQVSDPNYVAQEITTNVLIAPGDPQLTFSEADLAFGSQSIQLSAASKSSSQIVYSVTSGSATIVGNLLTVTGIGSVKISASQSANANYSEASVSTRFEVLPAVANLKVTPISQQVFGVLPFTVSATSDSPGPISYVVSSGPARMTGSMVQLLGAGLVTITATQGAATNFAAQTSSIAFTVLPGSPNLTLAIAPQVYGVQPLTLGAQSLSSGSISYSVISGPATITGSSLTVTGAGTIAVSAAQVADANYSSQMAAASFVVSPAVPGLTLATVGSVTFGDNPITLNATSASPAPIAYNVLSGSAIIGGNTLTPTGAGTIVLGASQASTQDYSAQNTTETVTVMRGNPALTFTSIGGHILGDAPFSITASSKSSSAVSYSIQSGPATILGSVVSITDIGQVTVAASVAADPNYVTQTVISSFVVSSNQASITPAQAVVIVGGSLTFAVTQASASSTSGNWVVLGGSDNGTIDVHGTYWAPLTLPAVPNVTIGYVSGTTMITASVLLQQNPPTLTSLTPQQLTSLSTPVTLTGTSFAVGVQVLVNGNAIPTTLLDSTHLAFIAVLPTAVNSTLQITAVNPNSNGAVSNPLPLSAVFSAITSTPAVVPLGDFQLTLAGLPFNTGSVISLNGAKLPSALNPDGTALIWGFLPPWVTGTIELVITDGPSGNALGEILVPVQSRAVPYDTAARFATQAAFGPNPSVVEHIQTIGLSAFVDEQIQTPGVDYSVRSLTTLMSNATRGSSLLRERVGWAFQSFIVSQAYDSMEDEVPYAELLEKDAFGNFRQLLTDITADASLGRFLNLAGNATSSDPTVHPNQNFARELMQLFSLGNFLLNDDGTTQTDVSGQPIPTYDTNTVIDLSRALTGWEFPQPLNPTFTDFGVDASLPLIAVESEHDQGSKVLFGNVSIPSGQTASQDRTSVLDAIFAHPNLPPYISRLLIQHLVKSAPTGAYVRRIAEVFEDDGTGVRGNLAAVVKAILLDPEARAGDTENVASDGFIQEPLLFELFAVNAIGAAIGDDTCDAIPGELGEGVWRAPTVFGFYDPTYRIPGTSINSPEFMLLNNVSIMLRNDFLWGIIEGYEGGFQSNDGSWLFTHFTTGPQIVEAMNHLLYHGQMPQSEQALITQYWSQSSQLGQLEQQHRAAFLALSADSYTVAQ